MFYLQLAGEAPGGTGLMLSILCCCVDFATSVCGRSSPISARRGNARGIHVVSVCHSFHAPDELATPVPGLSVHRAVESGVDSFFALFFRFQSANTFYSEFASLLSGKGGMLDVLGVYFVFCSFRSLRILCIECLPSLLLWRKVFFVTIGDLVLDYRSQSFFALKRMHLLILVTTGALKPAYLSR